MKRLIDADVWINKLQNIVKDENAPSEYVDYCLHLIGEIESEVTAQVLKTHEKAHGFFKKVFKHKKHRKSQCFQGFRGD